MTEISALLGRVQLSHLDEFLNRRRQLAAIYVHELSGQPEFSLILPKMIESSSFWKVPLLLNQELDRALITQNMTDAGVAVDWAYQPALHLQPVFRSLYGTAEGLLPITEDILSRHLCLPCHPRMTDEDASYVARTLKDVIKDLDKNRAQR